MSQSVLRRIAWVLCIVCALASPVWAQDFRGTIAGMIKDATGVVPGVSVVVKNLETGVVQTVVTDGKGQFQVPYLIPGMYSVAVELKGYKSVVRVGYQVRVAEVTSVEILLEPGGLTETVTVTVATPLLNTQSGVSGTTIDAKQIAQLPLGDGTAYMLTRLAPGIMDSSDLHFARPMDNANLSGIISNGVLGGNEFLIDGAPNMSNTRGVGFSPPSDAISQFKVQTNAYDAQAGHTAGATVNLTLKSGTNNFHGAAQYFNRDASRTATPLLTKRAGAEKPTRTYNRVTASVNGPVVKNRTFFMVAYEHLRDVQPEPAKYTVPTVAMRAGDFSEFTTLIYDPATATGSTATRTPFLNNQIPANRINPVAAAYAAMYPLPNLPGNTLNYFTNQLRPYDYDAYLGRLDHNLNSGNRIFASAYFNKRREDRYNWAQDAQNATNGAINGFLVTQGYDYRNNLGVNGGWTSVRSSSTLIDFHGSFTRFGEYRDPAQTLDPATLGFSAAALQAMNGYQYLPFITFGAFSQTNSGSTISSLGSMRSDWGDGFNRPMRTISLAPTVTRIYGDHTFHAGYDFRHQVWNITNNGFPGGRFQFNGAYTKLNNAAPLNDRGQVFAQFLLGLPSVLTGPVASTAGGSVSSQFEIASPGSFTQMYHGLFLQDDWRVSDRLTVNLGLRFEANSGMSESQNRNLGGFDTVSASPIEAAAVAAYALNPIAQIPVSEFKVKGGLMFADGPVNNMITKFLPRASAAYRIGEKTVVRGGIGEFSYDYFFENINQAGFSQATPVLVTNDGGLTFTGATLSDPLPSGQLIQPVGSALGLSSQLGQQLGTLYQPDREGAFYTRWELAVQRDLGDGWLAAFTYIGSRGSHLPVARQWNNVPVQYLSTSRSRDAVNETFLSGTVPNPFFGLLPGSAFNGATVARNQLLRPYPHFSTFAVEEYVGSDSYTAETIQLEKRFGSGNSFTVQYTHSELRDKLNYLNPQDQILEDRISPNDRPNRVSIGTSLRLPFGKDEHWGKNWNTAVDLLAGGWQMSGTYQFQSGFPIPFGAVYFDGACDINALKSNIGQNVNGAIAGLDTPGWDTSCFYFHDALVQTNGVDDPVKQRADTRIQVGNNVRYFPSTLAGMRNEALHLMDIGIYKNFSLPNKQRLQLRVELINALNYTVLFSPDATPRNATFGFITADRNNPRDIQIGLRWTF